MVADAVGESDVVEGAVGGGEGEEGDDHEDVVFKAEGEVGDDCDLGEEQEGDCYPDRASLKLVQIKHLII